MNWTGVWWLHCCCGLADRERSDCCLGSIIKNCQRTWGGAWVIRLYRLGPKSLRVVVRDVDEWEHFLDSLSIFFKHRLTSISCHWNFSLTSVKGLPLLSSVCSFFARWFHFLISVFSPVSKIFFFPVDCCIVHQNQQCIEMVKSLMLEYLLGV